jgi:hypothetical protein
MVSMPLAEFEEREFEIAAIVELSAGSGTVLSPGQVAEKVLGYDTATSPATENPIWEVLKVPRPPGLRLMPMHWPVRDRPPPGQLPSSLISLILQFKRPTFLHGARAAQWEYWRCPYYRFERTAHQHRVLRRLERRLGEAALVRYAAPAFWKRGELERAHLERTVLRRSGFVSPADLGGHKVWTYIREGVDGRANPSGRRLPFRTFDALFEPLRQGTPTTAQAVVPFGDRLDRHLDMLGAAARDREPVLRRRVVEWMTRLRAHSLGLNDSQIRQLGDIASIVTILNEVSAGWCITFGPPDDV